MSSRNTPSYRPAAAIELTKRFLRVHGDEWEIECEVREVEAPAFED